MADDIATLRRILRTSRTIAVVGLSAEWHRPSFFAAKYMQEHGYRIVPVNPRYEEILGERCHPDLATIECRRHRRRVPPDRGRHADRRAGHRDRRQVPVATDRRRNEAAAALAASAGLDVVMDRCVKIEHARLFGGLGWAGSTPRVISARRPV